MSYELFENIRGAEEPQSSVSEERILKVKDLLRLSKSVLERNFPEVIVEGEISNFKKHVPSGHLYFTLKDDEAQVRVVMWRSDAAQVRFDLGDGMKILVKGKISIYEPRGDFQLYALSILPVGQGALQLAFDQLKKKLEDEGLFSEDHKKPLPEFPERIGVVTSLEGAAIRDIISIINRRFPLVELVIYPVKVQGDGAAEEIAEAIVNLNRVSNTDVIIVGRGGGSLEDLWAFNEEVVARAIYDSRIPVISAVGHQVDFTIADFVADVRAATPSAAAELVVPDKFKVLYSVQSLLRGITKSVEQRLHELSLELDKLTHHYALRQPASLVDQRSQFVDDLTRRMQAETEHFIKGRYEKLASVISHLTALSPQAVLKRGYAFVEGSRGVIGSVKKIEVGENAKIHLHDGTLDSQITGKYEQVEGSARREREG
ncbi:MAG TPA: exodeoxyribonuclease VII large subunit [Candidatus Acidoferrales bacterium]|nr:exodeoxyribonuclease VII large subunit [Candidatus Acidoferrales bacterium]